MLVEIKPEKFDYDIIEVCLKRKKNDQLKGI